MTPSTWLLVLCVLAATKAQYLFDDPDLETDLMVGKKEVKLEAFPAKNNDKNKKGASTWPHLAWVTFDNPELETSIASNNQVRIMDFLTDRVAVNIAFLNNAMRESLAQAANKKYDVKVVTDQIMSVSLSQGNCTLEIQSDDVKQLQLLGRAGNLHKKPLRIVFDAPNGSPVRSTLEQKNAHLWVHCRFLSGAQNGKQLERDFCFYFESAGESVPMKIMKRPEPVGTPFPEGTLAQLNGSYLTLTETTRTKEQTLWNHINRLAEALNEQESQLKQLRLHVEQDKVQKLLVDIHRERNLRDEMKNKVQSQWHSTAAVQ